jgi:hypothetical protein
MATSSTEVQSPLELEAIKALSQLTDADKKRVLEYIESLYILEKSNNE